MGKQAPKSTRDVRQTDGGAPAQPREGASDGRRADETRRSGRGFIRSVLRIGLVLALFAAAGWFAIPELVQALGGQRIEQEAQRAVARLIGRPVVTEIRDTRISIDGSLLLGVDLGDVTVKNDAGQAVVKAGRLTFGVKAVPLASGELRFGDARIADAELRLPAFTGNDGLRDGTPFLDERGLVDTDRLLDTVFSALRQAIGALGGSETRSVVIDDMTVVLSDDVHLTIDNASLKRGETGGLTLEAQMKAGGRLLVLSGSATGDRNLIKSLDLALQVEGGSADGEAAGLLARLPAGSTRIAVKGSELNYRKLGATIVFDDARLPVSEKEPLDLSGRVAVSVRGNRDRIAIDRSWVATGRSRIAFRGNIESEGPASSGGREAGYRLEFFTDDAVVAAEDSSEPTLHFMGRFAGRYEPSSARLYADVLEVFTGAGRVLGKAEMDFSGGRNAGLQLALSVPSMPVGQAKQLWPWFAAPGARRWTMQNVFGGQIVDSNLRLDFSGETDAADGAPEASGYFRIDGARFDVAGDIPPMRDAVGTVEFRDNDVDVTLSGGTVFMPSGRNVKASNGTFFIRDRSSGPSVGALEIDIAGEADAIVELASFDPIDVSQRIGIEPAAFTGSVNGHISADIPLASQADRQDIPWRVDLSYSGLAIAEPVEGQMISEAEGSVVLDPLKAVVSAEAKLNGLPATLGLVEPFGGDVKRERSIDLVMDDASRRALFPGLDLLLSGPVALALGTPSRDGVQPVKADLGDAVVKIPWAGWKKGAGVPAEMTFSIVENGTSTVLEELRLAGETFLFEGTVELDADNELSSARFDTFRLNRSDDVRLSVDRAGQRYDVAITGGSFDGRSVIKSFVSEETQSSGPAVEDAPVTLTAQVDTVRGFASEALSDVSVEYESPGGGEQRLTITGATSSGTPVSLRDFTRDGRRSVEMRSAEAGSLLRFLDIYDKMQGGRLDVRLAAEAGAALSGVVETQDFTIVNEPRLRSLVSSSPSGGKSLSEAVRRDIDVSSVRFGRGYAQIEKGPGYLHIGEGVLRGPLIGATFQGMLYDGRGNMELTGTFMPAYGLNRIFGEIPLIGQILGNGRDRGLIGITFKLAGQASNPQVFVNPISAIAPGIFRSIFEFR